MTKRLLAALLVLAASGAARAGEQEIVDRLKKAGVSVRREWVDGERDVLFVQFEGKRHTDEDLADLCELRSLRRLVLNETGVTDAGLRTGGGRTRLRSLYLRDTRATEAGLKDLRGLGRWNPPSLRSTCGHARG